MINTRPRFAALGLAAMSAPNPGWDGFMPIVRFGEYIADPPPTPAPTTEPTLAPTAAPTTEPTLAPTASPTVAPTPDPTVAPIDPEDLAQIETDPDVVVPGGTATVTGSGWLAGSVGAVSITDGETINVTVGVDGTFSVVIDVPTGGLLGSYTITARGVAADGSTVTRDELLGTAGRGLPDRAMPSANAPLALLVVVLMALTGAGALALTRRRA